MAQDRAIFTIADQWPWTTRNLVFKVTPFFDIEYLTNGYTDTAIVTIEGE